MSRVQLTLKIAVAALCTCVVMGAVTPAEAGRRTGTWKYYNPYNPYYQGGYGYRSGYYDDYRYGAPGYRYGYNYYQPRYRYYPQPRYYYEDDD